MESNCRVSQQNNLGIVITEYFNGVHMLLKWSKNHSATSPCIIFWYFIRPMSLLIKQDIAKLESFQRRATKHPVDFKSFRMKNDACVFNHLRRGVSIGHSIVTCTVQKLFHLNTDSHLRGNFLKLRTHKFYTCNRQNFLSNEIFDI